MFIAVQLNEQIQGNKKRLAFFIEDSKIACHVNCPSKYITIISRWGPQLCSGGERSVCVCMSQASTSGTSRHWECHTQWIYSFLSACHLHLRGDLQHGPIFSVWIQRSGLHRCPGAPQCITLSLLRLLNIPTALAKTRHQLYMPWFHCCKILFPVGLNIKN